MLRFNQSMDLWRRIFGSRHYYRGRLYRFGWLDFLLHFYTGFCLCRTILFLGRDRFILLPFLFGLGLARCHAGRFGFGRRVFII